MRRHPLLLIASALLLGSVLSGCFGNGDDAGSVDDDTKPGVFEENLFVNQVMFHPYPGGMLSALQFSTKEEASSFDPPVFRVTEGDTVRITLMNTSPTGLNHTIHWHGLHVPWDMDGVPYLTQDPVGPLDSYTYEFTAGPPGTHWFHCHVDAPHHLDMGMYGVIIVEPKDGEPYDYDREEVLILDDWDSRHLHQSENADPQMTADSLKDNSGDPFNQADRSLYQLREVINDPRYPAVRDYYENPARYERDWYPETFPPWEPVYDTFTINGYSYPWTEPLEIAEGETMKIRLVNAGHSTNAIHIHGHHFKVTHKDGYPLPDPYMADTVLIGPGERYDVLLEGNNPGVWMLHDHTGEHAQNDRIAPGGIMTHVVYEGWHEEQTGGDHNHLRSMRAGDFLGLYT